MTVTSDCGAVTLLARIFHKDEDKLKTLYGLPLRRRNRCVKCGKLISSRDKSGLCPDCFRATKKIQVSCSECGKLSLRSAALVIWDINHRGQQFFFCDRHCLGRHAGKHYGFATHPENISTAGKIRKWDWDMVWQKHLKTGYGGPKLSRLLGIPQPTISCILTRMRRRR